MAFWERTTESTTIVHINLQFFFTILETSNVYKIFIFVFHIDIQNYLKMHIDSILWFQNCFPDFILLIYKI